MFCLLRKSGLKIAYKWLLPPYGSDREGIFVFVLERWLSASNNTEDALVPERE